jgi:hypothetical protein
LTTRQEVFADRGYQLMAALVPRTQAGALITDEGKALAQTLEMVRAGRDRRGWYIGKRSGRYGMFTRRRRACAPVCAPAGGVPEEGILVSAE